MKRLLYTILFLSIQATSFSQGIEELQSINKKAKVMFVTPDALDKLLIDLRKYETAADRSQDSLVLDTYDAIASAYMANNHYKRAYEIYDKYIARMEDMLRADKEAAISSAKNTVSGRQQVDESKLTELRNKLDNLKKDNDALTNSRQSFKRYFSFALIFLTAIFAIMLVTAGLRMFNIRSSLQKNRERMKSIHRLSVIGKNAEGLKANLKISLAKIGEQIKDLQQLLKKQETPVTSIKQATQALNSFDKNFQETVNKL